MADFVTSDIYKEFIKSVECYYCVGNCNHDFSEYKDDIIKIMELKNLWDDITYGLNGTGFGIYFDSSNEYNSTNCESLHKIVECLNVYNNYNVIYAYDSYYIMGLSSNKIKSMNIDRDDLTEHDIKEIIEKYPEYDFRRIWPTNDIKIALKD